MKTRAGWKETSVTELAGPPRKMRITWLSSSSKAPEQREPGAGREGKRGFGSSTALWHRRRRSRFHSVARRMTMGRPAHEPDPVTRRQVEAMAAYGIPETYIATVIEIDPKTLRRHYRKELDTGHIKANTKVAENLYRRATGEGREAVTAAIFWLKTRARWKETTVHEVAGPVVIDDGLYDERRLGAVALLLARACRKDGSLLPGDVPLKGGVRR